MDDPCFGLKQPSHDGDSQTSGDDDDDSDEFSIAMPLELHPEKDTAAATIPSISPDEMNQLLQQQLNKLPLHDREKIYNDVHGVSEELHETPELIRANLQKFDQELDLLQDIPAYDMAALMNPDYVQNEEFRLRFLRADVHDAKRAARRFALHFQAKLDLFGRDKLVKDITQDDLNDGTLASLYHGFSQFLPLRDRAGRLVHVQFVQPKEIDFMDKVKMDFYMAMIKSEDDEIQRKGCVGVRFYNGQWLHNQTSSSSSTQNWQAPKLLSALPLRPTAMHLCHDSKSIWSPIFAIMKFVVGFFIRSRMREHYGTHEQCLFQLQTFGIVTQHCFPLSEEGKIQTEYHYEMLTKRRNLERLRQASDAGSSQTEESSSISSTELEPIFITGQFDVLLGRGKRYYENLGNVRFRHWVECKAEAYNATSSAVEKKRITSEIVQLVRQSGGRFLKDSGSAGWVEVDDETARLKVSHAFRNIRLKTSGEGNKSTTSGKKRLRETSQ